MGGLCGGIGGEVETPEIDLAKIGELITENEDIKNLPETVQKNEADFTDEVKKLKKDDEKFEVPDAAPKLFLNKGSSKEDIRTAAVKSALGGTVRDGIKEKIWEAMEPEIEPQLPENALMKKAASAAAEKAVHAAVDAALDKMVEKLSDESGEDDNDDNDKEEVDDAVKEAMEEAKDK